jgi:hypothetical protein
VRRLLVRRGALALVLAGALALLCVDLARAADDIRTIPTRPGVTEAFILVRPSGPPVASVILFAGGNGLLALGSGKLGLGGNFLVRNRARFASEGLLVAVVDTPSDHPGGLDGFRTSAAHSRGHPRGHRRAEAGGVGAGVAHRHQHGDGVGGQRRRATQHRRTGRARAHFDGDARGARAPRVGGRRAPERRPGADADCPSQERRLPVDAVFRHARAAARLQAGVADGAAGLRRRRPAQSGPCDARAAHGYFGIDAPVVSAIVVWIKATPRP